MRAHHDQVGLLLGGVAQQCRRRADVAQHLARDLAFQAAGKARHACIRHFIHGPLDSFDIRNAGPAKLITVQNLHMHHMQLRTATFSQCLSMFTRHVTGV